MYWGTPGKSTMNEKYAEIYRMQQYEEVMTVCNEIQELNLLDLVEDLRGADGGLLRQARPSRRASACAPSRQSPGSFGAAHPAKQRLLGAPSSPKRGGLPSAGPLLLPQLLRGSIPVSNCDFSPVNSMHCNKTTVLDLDTHVVTTVENGLFASGLLRFAPTVLPGRAEPGQETQAWLGYYVSEIEKVPDLRRAKRAKFEDSSYASMEPLDRQTFPTSSRSSARGLRDWWADRRNWSKP